MKNILSLGKKYKAKHWFDVCGIDHMFSDSPTLTEIPDHCSGFMKQPSAANKTHATKPSQNHSRGFVFIVVGNRKTHRILQIFSSRETLRGMWKEAVCYRELNTHHLLQTSNVDMWFVLSIRTESACGADVCAPPPREKDVLCFLLLCKCRFM